MMSYLLMIVIPDYLFFLAFVILWPTLYVYWPRLTRWLGFLKFSTASAPRRSRPPASKRPLCSVWFEARSNGLAAACWH